MYNRNLSENSSEEGTTTRYNDSKYVADILSSMANGEPAAPSYTLPAYATSGVTTGATPTLTPTTLANIEQTFIELQSVPVNTGGHDHLTQGGFVPPIVDPISGSDQTPGGTPDHYDYSDSDCDSEWIPAEKLSRDNGGKSVVTSGSYSISRGRKHPRRDLDDLPLNCSPEEDERRRVRRERNKVAAAKCRQRRVDQTNRLVTETEKLEDDKANLESEIQTLQQQKDQLEFILQAHKPLCKADCILHSHAHGAENGISSRVKNEFQPSCGAGAGADADQSANGGTAPLRLPTIKQEIPDYGNYNTNCALKSDMNSMHASSRPSTLPLVSKDMASRSSHHQVSVSSATGISITTPSSGFFSFSGLEMADGHTGLTPLGGPSCASQIQRSSTDSSPDGMGSPTLISL